MITDTELRKLRPKEKTFKVADRDGMYVTISTAGTKSFRYDYRLNGRRETLTIGRYDDTAGAKHPRDPSELDFGMTVSLAEARSLLAVECHPELTGLLPEESVATAASSSALTVRTCAASELTVVLVGATVLSEPPPPHAANTSATAAKLPLTRQRAKSARSPMG